VHRCLHRTHDTPTNASSLLVFPVRPAPREALQPLEYAFAADAQGEGRGEFGELVVEEAPAPPGETVGERKRAEKKAKGKRDKEKHHDEEKEERKRDKDKKKKKDKKKDKHSDDSSDDEKGKKKDKKVS
jgi:hypothetical protein